MSDTTEILLKYLITEEADIVEDFIQRMGFETCRKNMGTNREAIYLVVPKTYTKPEAYYAIMSKIFIQVVEGTFENTIEINRPFGVEEKKQGFGKMSEELNELLKAYRISIEDRCNTSWSNATVSNRKDMDEEIEEKRQDIVDIFKGLT